MYTVNYFENTLVFNLIKTFTSNRMNLQHIMHFSYLFCRKRRKNHELYLWRPVKLTGCPILGHRLALFFSSPSHILNHQTSTAHYACRTNKQASEKVNMSGNTIVDGARWASEIIADWTNKRFGGNFAGSYESSDISDTAHLTEGENRTVSQEGSFRMFPCFNKREFSLRQQHMRCVQQEK